MASGDTVLQFTDLAVRHHLDGPATVGGNTDHRWSSQLQGVKYVSPPQNYGVSGTFSVALDAVANALPHFDFVLDPAKTYDVIIKEH